MSQVYYPEKDEEDDEQYLDKVLWLYLACSRCTKFASKHLTRSLSGGHWALHWFDRWSGRPPLAGKDQDHAHVRAFVCCNSPHRSNHQCGQLPSRKPTSCDGLNVLRRLNAENYETKPSAFHPKEFIYMVEPRQHSAVADCPRGSHDSCPCSWRTYRGRPRI